MNILSSPKFGVDPQRVFAAQSAQQRRFMETADKIARDLVINRERRICVRVSLVNEVRVLAMIRQALNEYEDDSTLIRNVSFGNEGYDYEFHVSDAEFQLLNPAACAEPTEPEDEKEDVSELGFGYESSPLTKIPKSRISIVTVTLAELNTVASILAAFLHAEHGAIRIDNTIAHTDFTVIVTTVDQVPSWKLMEVECHQFAASVESLVRELRAL